MENIKQAIAESIAAKQLLLADEALLMRIQAAADVCIEAFERGNRLWLCGNGGSAADAQHIAAELTGRFYRDRRALPAEALHVNGSYLTAVANDYSFDEVYARMIQGVAQAGDVLIALSTSGNSRNIVAAARAAQSRQITTIGFTGAGGGELRTHSNILLNVPATDTPRIQECHILLGHILCECIESRLF